MKVKVSELIAMFAAAGVEGTEKWTADTAMKRLAKLEKVSEDEGAMKKLKKDKTAFNLYTALMKAAEDEKEIDVQDDLKDKKAKAKKEEKPAKKGKGKAAKEEDDEDEEEDETESEDDDDDESDGDEEDGDDDEEESEEEDDEEEEEKPVKKGKKAKKEAKPAKKGKKAKDEDEDEEEEEEEEESDDDDDEEEDKKSKKKKKKSKSEDSIEKNAYGHRIKDGDGKTTRAHKIDSVFLGSKDAFTAAEVQKKAKYTGPVHGHLRHLLELGVIKKKDDGTYKRIKSSI